MKSIWTPLSSYPTRRTARTILSIGTADASPSTNVLPARPQDGLGCPSPCSNTALLELDLFRSLSWCHRCTQRGPSTAARVPARPTWAMAENVLQCAQDELRMGICARCLRNHPGSAAVPLPARLRSLQLWFDSWGALSATCSTHGCLCLLLTHPARAKPQC